MNQEEISEIAGVPLNKFILGEDSITIQDSILNKKTYTLGFYRIYQYFTNDGVLKKEILHDTSSNRKIYKAYYSNGNIKKYNCYLRDIEFGEWSEWYNNGNYKSLGFYPYFTKDSLDPRVSKLVDSKMLIYSISFNRKHGRWLYWYENGKIMRIENYINGKAIGRWKYYSEDGELIKVEEKN